MVVLGHVLIGWMGRRDVMLELSMWISRTIGWPVVGAAGFAVVLALGVAWVSAEWRYERKRRRRAAELEAERREAGP